MHGIRYKWYLIENYDDDDDDDTNDDNDYIDDDKGSHQNKKTVKVGNLSQPAWPPRPLANLGILNCYFFIGYLGLIDHEMDFEMNLFFSLTKVVWHLEKMSDLPYIRCTVIEEDESF